MFFLRWQIGKKGYYPVHIVDAKAPQSKRLLLSFPGFVFPLPALAEAIRKVL